MNKGTTIIRFRPSLRNYDMINNLITKTKGRLLLSGNVSVTNYPSTAQIYIYDHIALTAIIIKPDAAASTADYTI